MRELEIERDGFLVELSHDDVPVVIEFEGPEVDHHLILVDVSRYLGSNVDLDRRRDAEPT